MTYNVFGGTSNLVLSIYLSLKRRVSYTMRQSRKSNGFAGCVFLIKFVLAGLLSGSAKYITSGTWSARGLYWVGLYRTISIDFQMIRAPVIRLGTFL